MAQIPHHWFPYPVVFFNTASELPEISGQNGRNAFQKARRENILAEKQFLETLSCIFDFCVENNVPHAEDGRKQKKSQIYAQISKKETDSKEADRDGLKFDCKDCRFTNDSKDVSETLF